MSWTNFRRWALPAFLTYIAIDNFRVGRWSVTSWPWEGLWGLFVVLVVVMAWLNAIRQTSQSIQAPSA